MTDTTSLFATALARWVQRVRMAKDFAHCRIPRLFHEMEHRRHRATAGAPFRFDQMKRNRVAQTSCLLLCLGLK